MTEHLGTHLFQVHCRCRWLCPLATRRHIPPTWVSRHIGEECRVLALVHIAPGLMALLGGLIALIHVGVQVEVLHLAQHGLATAVVGVRCLDLVWAADGLDLGVLHHKSRCEQLTYVVRSVADIERDVHRRVVHGRQYRSSA